MIHKLKTLDGLFTTWLNNFLCCDNQSLQAEWEEELRRANIDKDLNNGQQ